MIAVARRFGTSCPSAGWSTFQTVRLRTAAGSSGTVQYFIRLVSRLKSDRLGLTHLRLAGAESGSVQPSPVFSTAFITTYRRHFTENNSLNKIFFCPEPHTSPGSLFTRAQLPVTRPVEVLPGRLLRHSVFLANPKIPHMGMSGTWTALKKQR